MYSHNAVSGIRTWQSLIILHLSETQQQRQPSQHDPEYRSGTEMLGFSPGTHLLFVAQELVVQQVQMGMSLTTKKESLFRFYDLKVIQSS